MWFGAVERWVDRELRALAAAYLEPTFDFDDLSYRLPSTVTFRVQRLDLSGPTVRLVRVEYDPRVSEPAVMPIDGIAAKLSIEPGDADS